MTEPLRGIPASRNLSPRTRLGWRTLQFAVWFLGAGIFAALLFRPAVGLHAFWDVLIPLAPALFALAPGLWRNVCPLGSTALSSRHAGVSRGRTPSRRTQGRFALVGLALLLGIVPLRHPFFDLSGFATAWILAVLALLSVGAGLLFEWKSGWCSGLCPVHPVEKLYGRKPWFTVPNAHCAPCERCVALCPDSTAGEGKPGVENGRRLAATLLTGGFAGFIWGWFQVPDRTADAGLAHLASAYAWPLGGFLASLLLFLFLRERFPGWRSRLPRLFAAAAIACYYWYRLPALFGFGPFPGDGMLVDLRGTGAAAFVPLSRGFTTAFFAWWILIRPETARPWMIRPPFRVPERPAP